MDLPPEPPSPAPPIPAAQPPLPTPELPAQLPVEEPLPLEEEAAPPLEEAPPPLEEEPLPLEAPPPPPEGTRIDEELQRLTRAATREQGPGALFVAEGVPPKYVPLDEVQPPRFREVFARTWAQEGGKSAFAVLLDDGRFHVVKVALEPASQK